MRPADASVSLYQYLQTGLRMSAIMPNVHLVGVKSRLTSLDNQRTFSALVSIAHVMARACSDTASLWAYAQHSKASISRCVSRCRSVMFWPIRFKAAVSMPEVFHVRVLLCLPIPPPSPRAKARAARLIEERSFARWGPGGPRGGLGPGSRGLGVPGPRAPVCAWGGAILGEVGFSHSQ